MPHRFQISRDSQPLYITVVTKNRLPVFKTDQMKAVLCRAIDEARTSAGFLLFAYVIILITCTCSQVGPRLLPTSYEF